MFRLVTGSVTVVVILSVGMMTCIGLEVGMIRYASCLNGTVLQFARQCKLGFGDISRLLRLSVLIVLMACRRWSRRLVALEAAMFVRSSFALCLSTSPDIVLPHPCVPHGAFDWCIKDIDFLINVVSGSTDTTVCSTCEHLFVMATVRRDDDRCLDPCADSSFSHKEYCAVWVD